MKQHDLFMYRAEELLQSAGTFNADCINTFDLEALKYFYEHVSRLIDTIKCSLQIARVIQEC